ncbi:MAG: tetratricopeptide repeat protein [bacterium]
MKRRFVLFAGLCLLANAAFMGCAAASDDGGKLPITTSSDRARELFLQGRDLQERLRAAEARSYFQQAIAEDADFALGHLLLALSSTSAKEFFAELEAAKSLAANASAGERLWIEAFAAGVDGDTRTQKKRFLELAAAYPNSERAQNLMGGFYFGQQEWGNAIEQYEKAIKINPEFSQPYNQLGYAYRFLGNYPKAESTFKKYTEVLPDDPNPYDSYAELLMKMGNFDESIVYYQKALSLNPAFFNAHLGIASNLNFQGDHKAARSELDKLVESAANNGQRRAAHFAKTISYVHEGNLEKALQEQQNMYGLAAKIEDAAAMSGDLGTMGNLLCEFGKPAEAMKKFEQALRVTMASNQSQEQKELAELFHDFNLCQVAVAKREFDTATSHANTFKQKAEANKNKFQIMFSHEMLGRIALATKDYDTAVTELKQANPQNPYNLHRLAMAYEGQGDPVQASALHKKATHFNAFNSLNQAYVAYRSGKLMSATK